MGLGLEVSGLQGQADTWAVARQCPLQCRGLLSTPHGGVMGRTWTFLPLGSGQQQRVQQQLQATSSSSSTVAGGLGREAEGTDTPRWEEKDRPSFRRSPSGGVEGLCPKAWLTEKYPRICWEVLTSPTLATRAPTSSLWYLRLPALWALRP